MYFRRTCFKVGKSYGRHVQHEVRFFRMVCYAGGLYCWKACCVVVLSFMRMSVVGGHVL